MRMRARLMSSRVRWRTFIMIHDYNVDAQLATPKAPARAVNTVMRNFNNSFQSSFMWFELLMIIF